MPNWIYYIIPITLLLFNCNQSEEGSKTDRGFTYMVHHDEPGEPPMEGDNVMFEIYMKHNDRILTSSKKRNQKGKYKIGPEGEFRGGAPAWVDVLPLLSVGDSVSVFSPADSLPRLPRGVEKGDIIHYEIVITDILDESGYKTYREEAYQKKLLIREKGSELSLELYNQTKALIEAFDDNRLGDDLVQGKNGVSYVIHEFGTGEKPQERDNVEMHYVRLLHDDTSLYDTSYRAGSPFIFPLGMGRAIQAFDETFLDFPEGTKATLFIPWETAYGITGNPPHIPEKADLVVYIHILSVNSF